MIGVLALQGAFREHLETLQRLDLPCREVHLPKDLDHLKGLIIPGGESTTIGRLMAMYDLLLPLARMARQNFPIWGTCAGAIVLAKDVGRDQPVLGVMNLTIKRNAFGRQLDSFETNLNVNLPSGNETDFSKPFPGVFIRAPLIEQVGTDVAILSTLNNGTIVAVQQGKLLATSFHPELTCDPRFHQYFLSLCN